MSKDEEYPLRCPKCNSIMIIKKEQKLKQTVLYQKVYIDKDDNIYLDQKQRQIDGQEDILNLSEVSVCTNRSCQHEDDSLVLY